MGISIVRESPTPERGFSRRYAVEVTIVEPKAESVYLLCSLDGFSRRAHQMDKHGESWRIVLRLLGGVYEYAFLADGSRTIADPENPESRKRSDGSTASVLRFGVPAGECARGDGSIDAASLYHDQSLPFLEVFREQVVFKLQVARNDVEKAYLVLKDGRQVAMDWASYDESFDYYECRLPLGFSVDYGFKAVDAGAEIFLGSEGPADSLDHCKAFPFPPRSIPTHDCPDWALGCTYYQILPDSFRNGDPTNDPKNVLPWGRPPTKTGYFGGDLAGLFQAVSYLKELGVSVVRLMPIFVSPSNDNFDVFDYYHADAHLGTDEMFAEVVETLHKEGIRVVLDMVFNHTGRGFFAFRDVVRNQESSQYVNWYNIHELPVTRKKSLTGTIVRRLAGEPDRPVYEAYRSRPEWPELNFRNFEVRGFIREIVTHWMKKALLDGVWLPVASGLPHFFLAEIRRTVKHIKPDAVLIGDVKADLAPWLGSGELDSATDSVFRKAVTGFFLEGKSSPSEFMAQLTRSRALTPWAATLAECNQIGNEFSARALTAAGEDKMRAMMAAIFQLTYPGSPTILYGDEIGMSGGPYPDCRKAMYWEAGNRDEEVLALYKKLLKVRVDSEAIRVGWLRLLAVDDQFDLVAFQRWTEKETAVVIMRRTGDPQVIDVPVPDGIYRDVISWDAYTVTGGSFRAELRGGSCLVLVGDKATYQGALGPMELSPL